MPEAPVVDASPLIHLSRAGCLPLLKSLASHLLVPEAVFREIRAKGESDPVVRAVGETPWLTGLPPVNLPPEIAAWQLGAGESAVLAWAWASPGTLAVLDDARARRLARRLDIPVIGTLGVVLRARQTGLVAAARPVIKELLRIGMYISEPVLEEVLELLGEPP